MDSGKEQDAHDSTPASDGVTFADYTHELGPRKVGVANALRAHLRIPRGDTTLHPRSKLEEGLAALHLTSTGKKTDADKKAAAPTDTETPPAATEAAHTTTEVEG